MGSIPSATLIAFHHPNTVDGHRHRLNTALTFDTLVEGSANRMARAAAMHVATMPGHLYNPLFIYGGVGLGKTHLVHAVGNKLLADNPNATAVYSPGLVKIDAPNSLVIKRESIEEQLGQRYDLQQMQVNLVTLSGHIDEDDDQFTLSWNH